MKNGRAFCRTSSQLRQLPRPHLACIVLRMRVLRSLRWLRNSLTSVRSFGILSSHGLDGHTLSQPSAAAELNLRRLQERILEPAARKVRGHVSAARARSRPFSMEVRMKQKHSRRPDGTIKLRSKPKRAKSKYAQKAQLARRGIYSPTSPFTHDPDLDTRQGRRQAKREDA